MDELSINPDAGLGAREAMITGLILDDYKVIGFRFGTRITICIERIYMRGRPLACPGQRGVVDEHVRFDTRGSILEATQRHTVHPQTAVCPGSPRIGPGGVTREVQSDAMGSQSLCYDVNDTCTVNYPFEHLCTMVDHRPSSCS